MKTLYRAFAPVMAALVLCAALAACGQSAAPAADTAPADTASENDTGESAPVETTGAAELSGTVNTDGSTSMADVMGVLTETYREVQPGVTVNYSGTGSGSGIEGVLAGTCDIGLSSRELKDSETEQGAVAHVVALDGVAVIVNPENSVVDLTVEQIADIYTGKVSNWSELGGDDAPIAVYGREDGSGTRSAFEEIVGVEGECAYTNEYGSTGDVIGNVAGNANAIGYASLSAVDDSVKAVAVGGVTPTEATVKDGSYAIQRPFLMVTKDGVELSPAAQAFLEYATSPDVAETIAAAGAVAPN